MNTPKSVLTLPKFLAWVMNKPQDGEYDYCKPQNCAIAQYLKANGFKGVSVGPYRVGINGEYMDIPPTITVRMDQILRRDGGTTIYTFGQLAEALKA